MARAFLSILLPGLFVPLYLLPFFASFELPSQAPVINPFLF